MKTLSSPYVKWINCITLGSLIFVLLLWYQIFRETDSFINLINRTLADSAMILIGLSFALSGIGYFFNFADHLVQYRKYLGLVGFWMILAHGVYSLINYLFVNTLSNRFNLYYTWNVLGIKISNLIAFGFGLLSLLIFIMMAIISNNWAVKKITAPTWRRLLRLGYIAYLLGGLHFVIKRISVWNYWWENITPYPPLSLTIAVIIIIVIILRIALQIKLVENKQIDNKK